MCERRDEEKFIFQATCTFTLLKKKEYGEYIHTCLLYIHVTHAYVCHVCMYVHVYMYVYISCVHVPEIMRREFFFQLFSKSDQKKYKL